VLNPYLLQRVVLVHALFIVYKNSMLLLIDMRCFRFPGGT
jgi:hypothetical protein